ncbi:DUF397 domain-containing protein [Streptomyces sp. NPDC059701]|uniref:DUF397 domain-containing protein n=1 Tax=Streptomyces sp. NPDC059701 TaxID=3346914 RepID=UPI00368E9D35
MARILPGVSDNAGRSLRVGRAVKTGSPAPAAGEPRWCKSSYSAGNGGDCVEVADDGTAVPVRDSKRPDAAVLSVPTAQRTAFVRMAAGV